MTGQIDLFNKTGASVGWLDGNGVFHSSSLGSHIGDVYASGRFAGNVDWAGNFTPSSDFSGGGKGSSAVEGGGGAAVIFAIISIGTAGVFFLLHNGWRGLKEGNTQKTVVSWGSLILLLVGIPVWVSITGDSIFNFALLLVWGGAAIGLTVLIVVGFHWMIIKKIGWKAWIILILALNILGACIGSLSK